MQPLYKLMEINSERLVIDRNVYQRKQHNDKITQIVASWDERIANEPKVSLRDGVYHVFDGQHTILAREAMNENNPVKILTVFKSTSNLTPTHLRMGVFSLYTEFIQLPQLQSHEIFPEPFVLH